MTFLIASFGLRGQALAQQGNGWLGHTFPPEKCLRIHQGEYEVRRKLCTIIYRITQHDRHFEIAGNLSFNKKFVPRKPKRVELEILFMDDAYICRKQVNLDLQVQEIPLKFSVRADKKPDQQFIRTYYTLHY